MDIKILFEDKDIIVAIKPSGMPSQADKTGDMDILSILMEKRGEVYLINRLDRPVGGVMVFARNKKAAAEISQQIQNKELVKEYLAVICGKLEERQGEFSDFLVKNQRINMSVVANKADKKSKEAKLLYSIVKEIEDLEFEKLSLVRIRLLTGRHHQIRVQFASRGVPLWGDSKYNKAFFRRKGFNTIGLYSSYLSFKHPRTGKVMEFEEEGKEGIFHNFQF